MDQRGGTAAEWTSADPTLLANEIGRETDTGKWKWGDGTTAWTSLTYEDGNYATAAQGATADSALQTKADVEGVLIGEISTHTHAGSGGASFTTVDVATTTYSIDASDVMLVDDDTAAGAVTATLPLSTDGTRYIVKKLGTTGNVVVDTSSIGSPGFITTLPFEATYTPGLRKPNFPVQLRQDHWSTNELEILILAKDRRFRDYGPHNHRQLSSVGPVTTVMNPNDFGGEAMEFNTYASTAHAVFPLSDDDIRSFTMMARVRMDDVTTGSLNRTVMSVSQDGGAASNLRTTMAIDLPGPQYGVWDSFGNGWILATTATPSNGQVAHMAFVHDHINNTRKLYINGVLENTQTGETDPSGTRGALYIGVEDDTAFDPWDGQMDDLRVYRRAMPEAEIARIAANPWECFTPAVPFVSASPSTAVAQTIDGAANATLTTQYESITIVGDGTNWHLV